MVTGNGGGDGGLRSVVCLHVVLIVHVLSVVAILLVASSDLLCQLRSARDETGTRLWDQWDPPASN